MKHLAAACVVAALAVAGACRPSAGGCTAGQSYCYCPAGASCTLRFSGPKASLFCANGNPDCGLEGGDDCSAACQNAAHCRATCGARSMVACQHVRGPCEATVGEGSEVRCEGAASCDVHCTAGCSVDCAGGGRCRAQCDDPARCNLGCDAAVVSCPDGRTKACGEAC